MEENIFLRTKQGFIISIFCMAVLISVMNSATVYGASAKSQKDQVWIIAAKSMDENSISIKYAKIRGAKKYQIVIAEDKKCTKKKKIYYTKKLKKKIIGLKSEKTYYVKVRAYKLRGKTSGQWSKVKKVKVKKAVIHQPDQRTVIMDPIPITPENKPRELFRVDEKQLVLPEAKKEYSIVVLNDLHIIQMDASIQQGQWENVQARYDGFCDYYGNRSADLWPQLIDKINAMNPDCVILNGDMIDYFSFANYNCLKEGISKIKAPVMYLRADHDLGLWYTDSITDEERDNAETQIDSNDGILEMEFDDFIIMGFNNSTSNLKEDGLNKVREIWAKKKPVILATHVPLESQIDASLTEKSKSVWDDRALLLGKNSYYKLDSITQEFLDMILDEDSPVVASIGGHLHFSFEDKLNSNIIQWVFDASHKGNIGCIKITN